MQVSVKQHVIHWQAAQAAVVAAVEKAEALGIAINVAVVDSGGNLAAFLRMPGAFLHSIDIAKDKAYTSAGFRFPTSQWKEIFPEAPMLEKGMPVRDRLVVFGGGLPIELEDGTLGGIGVSGGSEEEDIVCAEAGIEAIKSML
ncbi:MAG: heme-binding protein [Candidatus Sedimenticola sp. 1PA]